MAKLKAQLSRYVAKARAGQTIEITAHRKPVARITGIPQQAPDGLARLAVEGRITPGKPGKLVFSPSVDLGDAGPPVSEIVLEDRGPR